MANCRQIALRVCRQTQPLAGAAAAHRCLEYLRAGHDYAYRPLQFLGRDCSSHRFGCNAQLGPETATDIGGQNTDIFSVDTQGIRKLVTVVFKHLVGAIQCQLVALPLRQGRMWLHCRAVLRGRRIHGVNAGMGL